MNWDQIEGKWKQFKGEAKRRWGQLTDSDMTAIGGSKDKLIGKLQERYGYERDRAEKECKEFAEGLEQGQGMQAKQQTAQRGGMGQQRGAMGDMEQGRTQEARGERQQRGREKEFVLQGDQQPGERQFDEQKFGKEHFGEEEDEEFAGEFRDESDFDMEQSDAEALKRRR